MPRKGVVYGQEAPMGGGTAPAWAMDWNGAQLGPIRRVTLTGDTTGLHHDVPKASHQHGEPSCHRGRWEAGALHPSKWVGPLQGLSLILRSLASQMSASETPQGHAGSSSLKKRGSQLNCISRP